MSNKEDCLENIARHYTEWLISVKQIVQEVLA
jgi:hypothetical protein